LVFEIKPKDVFLEVVQGPRGVITFPTLLGPVVVWSQKKNTRLLLTVRYFESF